MKKINLFFSIILIVMFCGCASVEFSPSEMKKTYKSRKSMDDIKVYRTKTPDKTYIEIGVVNARTFDDMNQAVEMLRKKAAENGGDAIIELEPHPGGASATVIRFKEYIDGEKVTPRSK